MHLAENLKCLRSSFFKLFTHTHVCFDRDRLCTKAVNLRQGVVKPVTADVTEHDIHALPGEGARHTKANTGTRAGDECGFALELLHWPTPEILCLHPPIVTYPACLSSTVVAHRLARH